MLFSKMDNGAAWMVVGLGNPGKKYTGTRHNVGFAALDELARRFAVDVKRSKFDGLCGTGRIAGQKVLLLKPQTFMNLSGQSVLKASEFYKLPAERVIVLFDDISLAPGVLRIRKSGSAGGHNGLKSIIAFIGEGFPRVKIGVGDRPRREYELADWVLSAFTKDEAAQVAARYGDVCGAVELMVQGKTDEAMSRYSGPQGLVSGGRGDGE